MRKTIGFPSLDRDFSIWVPPSTPVNANVLSYRTSFLPCWWWDTEYANVPGRSNVVISRSADTGLRTNTAWERYFAPRWGAPPETGSMRIFALGLAHSGCRETSET